MKKREHFFKELDMSIFSVSENDYSDYLLCFKKIDIADNNRLYYWSLRSNKGNSDPCRFHIAGKLDFENILSIITVNDNYNFIDENTNFYFET